MDILSIAICFAIVIVIVIALSINKHYVLNDAHIYVWFFFALFLLLLGGYLKNIVKDGMLLNLLLVGVIFVMERRLKDITDKFAVTVEKLSDANNKLDELVNINGTNNILLQTNEKLEHTNKKLEELVDLACMIGTRNT